MDKEMSEYYHNKGMMPDWIYHQVNGKSAEENYIEQKRKRAQKFRALQPEADEVPEFHITSEVKVKK